MRSVEYRYLRYAGNGGLRGGLDCLIRDARIRMELDCL